MERREILDHLVALRTKRAANEAALEHAQRRRRRWVAATEARWARYSEALAEGVPTQEQARLRIRARRAGWRARFWLGRIKELHRKIDHLEVTQASVKHELREWQREHGIRFINENAVRAGADVPIWRLQKAAMLRSEHNYLTGHQPGFYTMGGAAPVYSHGLWGYPLGHRWDCSVWNDSINYTCGLESPSGHEYQWGGFTGTEYSFSTPVERHELTPGDFIIYLRWSGDTIGEHVERVLDPDREITMGHGDSAIDRNSRFDIFGTGGLYVFRRMRAPCPMLR